MKKTILLLSFALIIFSIEAQTLINIALINDNTPESERELEYQQSIESEITSLLKFNYQIKFNSYNITESNIDISELFTVAYSKNDIVVAIGINATNHAISIKKYSKPTIASIVIDPDLQGLKKTEEGTSGIDNFTYIESPFDIKRDLNILYEIKPYDNLVVLSEKRTIGATSFISELFTKYLNGKEITINSIYYSDDISEKLNLLKDTKTAVYALPHLGKNAQQTEIVFQEINKNKFPSAALLGEQNIAAGALAGYETEENIQKIPRRIALTIMKIADGTQVASLPVEMQTYGENLIINMKTARQIDIYPSFDIMAKSTRVNLNNDQSAEKLTLRKSIAEALESNLEIIIQATDINIADTEIGIAKSDLLPRVDVFTNLSAIDETTAFSRQGAQGRANWVVGGSASQIIFSEPILANVAIQKLLKEGEVKQLLQTQLDVIIDVTTAYMNILFAKNNLNIQQQNVKRNKDNFNIAKAKESIGISGSSDINRWEAESANANIELNNAYASLRQAKFRLNQLLNRNINDPLDITETTIAESMLIFSDDRMVYLNDYGNLEKFSNFLVGYAKDNLPELAQIDLGLRIQNRLQLSRQRALFLPSVVLNGSSNRVIEKYNVPEGLPSLDNSILWDVGVTVSHPIFQGNKRKKLIEQSKLSVIQLEDTRSNTENQLELLIRSSLENVGASFSRMSLSKQAAESSNRNFMIVQYAYSAGQTNITTLIDAQSNSLATELQATNAVYAFIQDFLKLERSIGYFNFLATPEKQKDFFNKVQIYFAEK